MFGEPTALAISRFFSHFCGHVGTFAESTTSTSNYNIAGEDAVFAAYGSVFRDGYALISIAGIVLKNGARGSMADCMVTGNVSPAGAASGALHLESASQCAVSRTTFRDNRAGTVAGCFALYGSSSLTVDASDIINCWSDGVAGMAEIAGSSVTITRSRMVGNGAGGSGGLVRLSSSESFLRIVDSTITEMNTAAGEFAIVVDDIAAPDFSAQFDTVVVDGSVDIFSHGKVLVQNCVGFNSTAVQNASVGTCQSTTDYCLAESCADERVGIDCICDVDGVPNPFPTDCMQSAAIEARRFLS